MTTGAVVMVVFAVVATALLLLAGGYFSRAAQRREDVAATGKAQDELDAELQRAHEVVDKAEDREKLRLARERWGKGKLPKEPPHP